MKIIGPDFLDPSEARKQTETRYRISVPRFSHMQSSQGQQTRTSVEHTPRQRHARGFLASRQVVDNRDFISACRCGVLHVPKRAAHITTRKNNQQLNDCFGCSSVWGRNQPAKQVLCSVAVEFHTCSCGYTHLPWRERTLALADTQAPGSAREC